MIKPPAKLERLPESAIPTATPLTPKVRRNRRFHSQLADYGKGKYHVSIEFSPDLSRSLHTGLYLPFFKNLGYQHTDLLNNKTAD